MSREIFVEKLDIRSKMIFSILFIVSLFFLNKINIFISIPVLTIYVLNARINKDNLLKLLKGI